MLHPLSTPRSPEETRSRILAATRELLAKKGRRGSTTREIADLAGVNEATIFRHFGHKDALLEACVHHYCKAVQLQELLAGLTGEVEADLLELAAFMTETMSNVRDLIIMSLAADEEDSAVGAAAWRAPMTIRTAVGEYMARRVADGALVGDPYMLARVFTGMIFARVIGLKKFPEGPGDAAGYTRFLVDVFLNGVRKK